MKFVRRGILLVVSSPSGAGKTTLAHRLARSHNLHFSVSYTTRKPRPGERDGVDYHFVSDDEFTRMVQSQLFAEWAVVHGNRYGTAISTVNEAIEKGVDCLFDIDYQGGRQIRQQWPDDSVLCFILPPSLAELERRLRSRGTESAEAIESRLAMAKKELAHYKTYDYLVVNEELETAYAELSSIYQAARCARSRNEPRAQALLAEAFGQD
ncbi:MAG: guanylate kinase [Deltaproteobacteria bacterium]|nr:guanylate kinase [Deltaproteobacteria bacterium]